jgi:hypothetical protein
MSLEMVLLIYTGIVIFHQILVIREKRNNNE